jgi:hypothetical protein
MKPPARDKDMKSKATKCGMRIASFGIVRLCAVLALGLLATGCSGPRPLKGGLAVTTRSATGAVQQELMQSENPAQASKQGQESTRVRTYTVPAGSVLSEACRVASGGGGLRDPKCEVRNGMGAAGLDSQPSTLNSQPILILSAPMPVTEREETHTQSELGAAQKDMARELGAKLSSLKGIVWVGAGLFVLGLASLVWPPLKALIASATTSLALMLGGVALMVLPSLVAGNELLMLGIVSLAVGGWFLAHRHGQLRGLLAAK